jgi:hypothetical protein
VADESITYRRDALYDEVWKDPVNAVAKRYGVSDVALSKVCRRLKVPLPWSGYWAQIRAGQQIRRPPLPPVPVGVPSEIVGRRPKRPGFRRELPLVERTIVVPSKLQNPHALVSEAGRLLRGREPQDGLLSCRATRCLDIAVSPALLARALRIMNTLIRALDKLGLQVEVVRARANGGQSEADGPPINATRARIADEWVQFALTEKRTLVREPDPEPPKWLKGRELESWLWTNRPQRKLVPNGTFALSIVNANYLGVRTVWQDGKRKRVEESLDEFVANLSVAAGAVKRHRTELESAQRERQEAEHRRFEREQERRKEAERERCFEEELHRWRLARDAREYLREIRGLLGRTDAQRLGESALQPSLAWVEAFVRRVDPLSQLRDRGLTSATSPDERESDPIQGKGSGEGRSAPIGREPAPATPEMSNEQGRDKGDTGSSPEDSE